MISAFNSDEDIHTNTAAQVFDMPPLFVTPETVSYTHLDVYKRQQMGYPVISLTGWQAGFLTESTHRNARIKKINTE